MKNHIGILGIVAFWLFLSYELISHIGIVYSLLALAIYAISVKLSTSV